MAALLNSNLYKTSDTIGGWWYKSHPHPNPFGYESIKQIDIPNVDTMTREEAEAWLIKNYLIPSFSKTTHVSGDIKKVYDHYSSLVLDEIPKGKETPQQNITNTLISVSQPVDKSPEVVEEKKTIVQDKPKRRFRVGEHYCIHPFRNKKLKREYEVKKTIYSIEGREVRILIMKQTKGDYHTKYCLNRKDCLIYHIKYEEGLEVFSMDLDWKLLNKKEKKS